MIAAILGVLGPVIAKVAGSFFPDPADELKRQKLMNEVQLAVIAQAGQIEQAAASVVRAEAESKHWITAAWRPLTMLTFVAIIANNYILVPWLQAFGFGAVSLAIPPDMWSLLQIGLGGYVVGRSTEKVAEKVAAILKK